MSWLFSRALVEEFLGASCLDGEPSAPLSGRPTQLAYLSPDKMTAFSRLSRFGMTFKPLTADRGEALLTSYLAVFHAKTSALPEKAQELTEPKAECGSTWRASLARFDPVSCSWKTAQLSLLEDSDECSVTWPRSGMTANGQCWELPMSGRRINETESGLWRTPSAREPGVSADRLVPIKGGTPGGMNRHFDKHTGRMAQIGLAQQVNLRAMWPTPTVCRNYNRKGASNTSGDGLATAVMKWPTPTARNAKEGAFPAEYTKNTPTLAARAGGKLNPTWVEWLMGWPLGWTDLKPLGMDKFQQWQQEHSQD